MKKSIFIIPIVFSVVYSSLWLEPSQVNQPGKEQILRHVVLLDFTEAATDSVIRSMETELNQLKDSIEQIKRMEFGKNIQQNADYDYCMLLTFDNLESLNTYEEHPLHLEFASMFGKYVDKKTEVDYWQ